MEEKPCPTKGCSLPSGHAGACDEEDQLEDAGQIVAVDVTKVGDDDFALILVTNESPAPEDSKGLYVMLDRDALAELVSKATKLLGASPTILARKLN